MEQPPVTIKKIFYRSPHNYDLDEASNEAAIPASEYGDSLTVQSHAEEADINLIAHRFGLTGKLPENPRIPTFGDFSEVFDFRSAQHALMQAQQDFMQLPAAIRARFDNDPQKLLEFHDDPANRQELVRMGILKESINGTTGTNQPPNPQNLGAPGIPNGGTGTPPGNGSGGNTGSPPGSPPGTSQG